VRRLFWLAVGLGAGATASIMASRWVKRQTRKLAPGNLAGRAVEGLASVGDALTEAWSEFRAGAEEREAEIRSSLPD
jgi:hypothetical protein